jgi:hypothetical protein
MMALPGILPFVPTAPGGWISLSGSVPDLQPESTIPRIARYGDFFFARQIAESLKVKPFSIAHQRLFHSGTIRQNCLPNAIA